MARHQMSGPEHYREAERLAGSVSADDLAAAQVHATLALAAATALIQPGQYRAADLDAWREVAGNSTGGKR